MEISAKRIKGVLGLIGVLFVLAPLTVFAANKVVVIPLVGDNPPLKNVVTVAKANGKFTDPVAAVNSITDASAGNPYVVVIAPGVYTITSPLQMKEYVDIAGSGQNVTKITGALSTGSTSPSAVIRGANHAALSSLTVENTGGGGDYCIAVNNYSASPVLTDVTATASGGANLNYGVRNYSSSSPTMIHVTATASGGSGYNYGVYNYTSSSPVMTQVIATGSGASDYNFGVYNYASSPAMTQVTATGSGGSYSYGVYNYNSSNPKIRHSTMEGGTDGLYSDTGCTSTVSQSTIIGGAVGPGTKTCVACDNGSGIALNGTCQ